MRRLPIGVRLTLWYVAIFATAQVVFGGLMWVTLRHHMYEIVDDKLRDEAEDLRNVLRTQKPDASVAQLQEEVAEEYNGEHAGEYLELYDEKGVLLYQSEKLKAASPLGFPAPERTGGHVERNVGEMPLRFLVTTITVGEHEYRARIGMPIWEVRQTLRAFRRYLLMLAPLLLALAAGVGYWLSQRALAPVDRLTRAARSIGGASMGSRLEVAQTGDELQRLADTLNEMLERIERSFRRLTEFTADASHELRTPVSLMRTEAELALRRSRNPEEYRGALEHILAEAERTTGLLDQLLAVARTDAGREFLEFREVDLRTVVEQAAEAWGGVLRAKELEFACEVPENGVQVRGDAAALRRVVDIMLDNAAKYAKERGSIRLGLREEAGGALLVVEDDGIGIPAEEQGKIFERFYRVDKARSRSQGGAGLGLAIAQWIVRQHRGTIVVESAEGNGATFSVRLPELTVDEAEKRERAGSAVG